MVESVQNLVTRVLVGKRFAPPFAAFGRAFDSYITGFCVVSQQFRMVEDDFLGRAVIKVVGIGGGGCNAVQYMHASNLPGVEFICANTDAQALRHCTVPKVLALGQNTTRGLGAGADPQKGREAVEEDRDNIRALLEGSDMVFITTGMGGGTGTGGAPVIAEIAREMGILTVGVVTKPFSFEQKRRAEIAQKGIQDLMEVVNSLIVIPNDKLMGLGKLSVIEAFNKANDVLLNAVRGVAELIVKPGFINLDFADVRSVMNFNGMAMMGIGQASGDGRARSATMNAIKNPLLEDIVLQGAQGLLANITAGPDFSTDEYAEVGEIASEFVADKANVKIGVSLDDSMTNQFCVTIVATGINYAQQQMPATTAFNALSNRQGANRIGVGHRPQASVVPMADYKPQQYIDIPAFLREKDKP